MNYNLTDEQKSEVFFRNITPDDCGVIAIQKAAGVSRQVAERIAKRHEYGVPGTVGMSRSNVHAAILEACRKPSRLEQVPTDRRDTVSTFAATHDGGIYVIHCYAHVMVMVDGLLYNGDANWGEQLEAAFRLVPA